MKKKIIIYLLAAVMILSPAAVFADTVADAASDDSAVTELEQVSADAQLTLYAEGTWNSTMTQFTPKGSSVPAKGLFKAPQNNSTQIVALFYADQNGTVAPRDAFVTAAQGPFYSYIRSKGGFDIDPSLTGPVTYYQKKDPDFGCYCIQSTVGIFAADGKTCYVQDNGTVKTIAGFINVGGRLYYVNAGGAIRTQAGLFKANNGKTYMSDASGVIITTAGIRQYGGSYYVIQSDGSVGTTVGFVRAGGKLCYVTNTNGVLAVNKEFKVKGKKYHALNDASIAVGGHKWGKKYFFSDDSGAIRTKKGVVKAGGQYYFVQKGGKLAVNKKVKYKGKSYIASKSSALYRGLFKWKKNLYYANNKAVLRTKAGVITVDAHKYYVQKGGKIKKNSVFTGKGKKYCADKDGRLLSGYFNWKGNYYLTNGKCVIITKQGLYSYRKQFYFVGKGGKLATSSFVEWKNKFYYANSKGEIVRSKFTYKRNGTKYTLHPSSKTGEIASDEYYKVFPEKAPKEDNNNDAQDANNAQ